MTRVPFVSASREPGAAEGPERGGRAEPASGAGIGQGRGPVRAQGATLALPLGGYSAAAPSGPRPPPRSAGSAAPRPRAPAGPGAALGWGPRDGRPRWTGSGEGEPPGRGAGWGRREGSARPEWAGAASSAGHIPAPDARGRQPRSSKPSPPQGRAESSLRVSPPHPPAVAPQLPRTVLGTQLWALLRAWRLRVAGRNGCLVQPFDLHRQTSGWALQKFSLPALFPVYNYNNNKNLAQRVSHMLALCQA